MRLVSVRLGYKALWRMLFKTRYAVNITVVFYLAFAVMLFLQTFMRALGYFRHDHGGVLQALLCRWRSALDRAFVYVHEF